MVTERGTAEPPEGGTEESGMTAASSIGNISTTGDAATEPVIFFFPFFFSPVIDEETAVDSFGFCFKSYSSFETLTTFLDEGVMVGGLGVPFAVAVVVDSSAGGAIDVAAIWIDVGSGVDGPDSDIGVDSLDAFSFLDIDFRDRFLGGELSTDPAFSSLGGD